MIESSPTSNDKVAALLTHIGGALFGFIPPLIVYFAVSNNPWLKEQGRNALNFQITMLIAWVVVGVLSVFGIGLFLIWPLWLFIWVVCIIAAVKANQGETFKYPLSLDLVKS
jgi:uncharacterized protein